MKNFLATLKANKKTVIRRTIIAGAVVTTVIVVGALYKKGAFTDTVLVETLEDGSVLLTETTPIA